MAVRPDSGNYAPSPLLTTELGERNRGKEEEERVRETITAAAGRLS